MKVQVFFTAFYFCTLYLYADEVINERFLCRELKQEIQKNNQPLIQICQEENTSTDAIKKGSESLTKEKLQKLKDRLVRKRESTAQEYYNGKNEVILGILVAILGLEKSSGFILAVALYLAVDGFERKDNSQKKRKALNNKYKALCNLESTSAKD